MTKRTQNPAIKTARFTRMIEQLRDCQYHDHTDKIELVKRQIAKL